MTHYNVERWTRSGRLTVGAALAGLVVLVLLPAFASGLVIDKLTTLFIYILLAVMWNLLAGYAGLVSVGQQAFFGVGGYLALRLVDAGLPPYLALIAGAAGAGIAAIPISTFALRLKGGEFAIAMWVIAEVLRILVMFDPLVQGETGTSLLALNAYDPELRRNLTYWLGLGGLALMLAGTFWLLRSHIGAAAQAIRDDEDAAASIGIDVMRIKQIIFVLAAFGCALAGTIWLASAITFLPRTNFGVQWTVFMLFMVLVGGLRTFEGPIIGALIFFLLQEVFGNLGVWYLAGLGVVAVGFALYLPAGLWGSWQQRSGLQLLSVNVVLRKSGQSTETP
ncbi:branched-chain amino acid ABC transporter permease [uncultured Devosia sp.]|uniref:branched-chain amino acid ABC transporter permease n=1 Tax=uncultured Devosia sp. TaxID=211434 RepID=UPI00262D386F|nr:branched-chain amino acid ABC transporter permease [uncultured Devosia sp.]